MIQNRLKKIATALFFVLVALPCPAQRVTISEAKKAAQTFLGRDTLLLRNRIDRVNSDEDSNGVPLLYEIVMHDSTIVLVSGNKAICPILATYNNAFGVLETDNIPCGLEMLMGFYRQVIAYATDNNVRTENNQKWQQLIDGETPQSRNESVGPLLTTKWGQSYSNDSLEPNAYNKFTPGGNGCQHCVAGCVAVSMGQVMNYYQEPIITYRINDFSEQFDWCHIPDFLLRSSPNFYHECEAISRLLSTCGEMVNMNYTCSVSSSHNLLARDALVNYFGYSSDAKWIHRTNTFLHLQLLSFLDSVKMSLQMGYPVIMGAEDPNHGGHSFVCDGYQDDRFSFNWGWNGLFNGFYEINLLGNINVGNQYVFSRNFDAIVFLHPVNNMANNICNNEIHLEDFYTQYYYVYGHSPLYHKPYDNTPKTMSVLYSSDSSSIDTWRTIPEGSHDVVYCAYSDIYLQNGFYAESGCDFTATIDRCESCDTRGMVNDADVVDGSTEYSTVAYNEDITESEGTGHTYGPFVNPQVVLYPNPSNGEVAIDIEGELDFILLYNSMGQLVEGWKPVSINENHVTLDVSALPEGAYLVRIATPSGTTTKKLLVRRQ